MFHEDELLPISALQHLLFCPRQCALIHLEGIWAESRLTAEGRRLHDKAHEACGTEFRGSVGITRGLPLRSLQMGLSGVADVVEFHLIDQNLHPTDDRPPGTVRLAGRRGWWSVLPVEYKRGQPKKNDCDRVQLCAQAMCLEEMLGAEIAAGQLFYGRTRRRKDVQFDETLRRRTAEACKELRHLINSRRTPQIPAGPKCDSCSLREHCLPEQTAGSHSAKAYLRREVNRSLAAGDGGA